MRTNFVLLSCTLLLSIAFVACQKNSENKPEEKPEEPKVPHLLSSFTKRPTDSSRYNYHYDASGRITKITWVENNKPEVTYYDIVYQGNEIIMYNPRHKAFDLNFADTVHLFTDGNGQVLKRVVRGSWYYDFPTNTADWTFFYDTTTYQYNADGIMISGIHTAHDTSWTISGPLKTRGVHLIGTITQTATGKNVIKTVEVSNSTTLQREGGNVYTSVNGSDITRTFDYSQSYPNKTDFSNAAVLNELNPFSYLPINRNYQNQPNKVTSVFKLKDANGNVWNTQNSEEVFQFNYNELGLMASKNYISPASGGTNTYTYEK